MVILKNTGLKISTSIGESTSSSRLVLRKEILVFFLRLAEATSAAIFNASGFISVPRNWMSSISFSHFCSNIARDARTTPEPILSIKRPHPT